MKIKECSWLFIFYLCVYIYVIFYGIEKESRKMKWNIYLYILLFIISFRKIYFVFRKLGCE